MRFRSVGTVYVMITTCISMKRLSKVFEIHENVMMEYFMNRCGGIAGWVCD